nr:tetratricopeptide repeat protein [Mesorhizobium sp.]
MLLELQLAGRLPEAEELCRRVLARTPEHPMALYMLGTLGLGVDDKLSIKYLARAVDQTPLNPCFHFSLGDAYLTVGEPALASGTCGALKAPRVFTSQPNEKPGDRPPGFDFDQAVPVRTSAGSGADRRRCSSCRRR